MKFIRYERNGTACNGILEGEQAIEISGNPFGEYVITGIVTPLDQVRMLPPVLPGKIIGVANVNYYSRKEAMNLPHPEQLFYFIKPINTLIGSNDVIELPTDVQNVAHELELTIVIGKKGKRIPIEQAREYIFGYTLANDITVRDYMVPGVPVGKAKSLDTINPLGPCIETEINLETLNYKMYVSGELRHDVNASDLIFSPEQIVSELSQNMTLEPGDVIMTGAPLNNIEFRIGDTIDIRCDQIGSMTNPVIGI